MTWFTFFLIEGIAVPTLIYLIWDWINDYKLDKQEAKDEYERWERDHRIPINRDVK